MCKSDMDEILKNQTPEELGEVKEKTTKSKKK